MELRLNHGVDIEQNDITTGKTALFIACENNL